MFLLPKAKRQVTAATTSSDEFQSESFKKHPVSSPSKMHMILRIRPTFTKSKKERRNMLESYSVPDSSTLITKLPAQLDSGNSRSKRTKSGEDSNTRRFSFTQIFNSEIDQRDFFDEGVKHRVVEFLNGYSSTLICYGTSDSGKTYTLYGTPASPGVVTRSIEFIFSALNCTLAPWYKPTRYNDIVILDQHSRSQEVDAREKLLSWRSIDREECRAIYEALEKSTSKSKSDVCKDSMYSLWISFVEIYNENVYDLLASDEEGKNIQLKMTMDKDGVAYLQGMKMLCATTGLEAFEILAAGQSRLSVVDTILGTKSSRSHSIFTIKLLKYVKDSLPEEVEISSISFCDLAGSGRLQRVPNSEVRLKESRSINTSLLVLGRCFSVVAEGRSRQSMGPFRESKFTRLFQRTLCGKENMSLIVNVNPLTEYFVETQSVLKFTLVASKVAMEVVNDPRKHTDYHLRGSSPAPEITRTKAITSIPASDGKTVATHENIKDAKVINEQLKSEIDELKATRFKREYEVRQELADFYSKLMNDLDESWRKRISSMEDERENLLKWSVRQVETFYKEKMNTISERRRKRSNSGDYEDDADASYLEQLTESFISPITSKINSLNYSFELSKEDNSNISTDKKQGDFESPIVLDWLKEVINIIKPTAVTLPKLEDSGDFEQSCYKLEEVSLTESLSTIKEALIEYQSSIRTLKGQLSAKSVDFERLQEQCHINQKELLEVRCQWQEAENERHHLLDKVQKLKMTLDSKNALRNFDTSLLEAETSGSEISDFKQSSPISKKNVSNDDYRLSLLESSLEKSDCSIQKSNGDYSSKNDSGIAVALDRESTSSTSEKYSQTNLFYDAENNLAIHERVDQLKTEDNKISTEHYEESNRVNELVQELSSIKITMENLKENLDSKEQNINEYKRELSLREDEIERLFKENEDMKESYADLSANLKTIRREYEVKLSECETKLQTWESSEISKYLDEYLDKSEHIQNQLLFANKELEKISTRCITEHIPHIGRLEKQLFDKTARIHELEQKLCEYKIDARGAKDLQDKLQEFENLMEKDQTEKENLRAYLHECSESQSELEDKLKRLTARIHERDRDILSLKGDLEMALRNNAENNKITKELSTGISDSVSKIAVMRREMLKSEEKCFQLERMSNKELSNISSRLGVFEKNNEILNMMKKSNDSAKVMDDKQEEVDVLKQLLREKDKELEHFKKNRDSTIEKYESLVHHLQDKSDGEHREPSKLKRLFPRRQKYVLGDIKESARPDANTEPKMHTWKTFEEEYAYSPSKCSSSHTTNFSPSSESIVSFDVPNEIEDFGKRIMKTESKRYLQIASSKIFPPQVLYTQSLRRLNAGTVGREFETDCVEVRRTYGRTTFPCQFHTNHECVP